MNYLFVCTQNQNRSPTAERVFREMLKENDKEGQVKSAGISPAAHNPLTYRLLKWADKIFCMEEEHKFYITYLYPELEKKIVVLNIPDIYPKDDPELVRVLREKIGKFLRSERF